MADSIVELCENMSLTEGEQVGLCIHEDDTADLRMMGGGEVFSWAIVN
jgi:hypothetical protein